MNDAVCRDSSVRFPASSAAGVRTGLRWRAPCGLFLCPPGTVCGHPVADGCAQGLLWQTAVHRASCGRRLCTAPAAPLGSPACRPPCGRARSPLTCGRSPQIRLSLSFSSFFSLFSFPSLSFPLCFFLSSSPPSFSLLLLFSLSLSTDHLLVSLGKPHWSRSAGCLKDGSLNTEQLLQGCLAVRLLGESCLSECCWN